MFKDTITMQTRRPSMENIPLPRWTIAQNMLSLAEWLDYI